VPNDLELAAIDALLHEGAGAFHPALVEIRGRLRQRDLQGARAAIDAIEREAKARGELGVLPIIERLKSALRTPSIASHHLFMAQVEE
jgi:hypothetical protein